MENNANTPVAQDYFMKPGYIFVSAKPTVISTVLGTSVSVCIHDKKRKVGGMNHFKYPATSKPDEATADYGNISTKHLVKMLLRGGSRRKDLEAQLFGGASNKTVSREDMGRKNLSMARQILLKERIPIVSEDIGGLKGRKVVFDTSKNEIVVAKVEKLRQKDWYPYDDDKR